MFGGYFRQAVAAYIACLTTFLAGCWISWASVSLIKLSDTELDTEHIGFRLSNYEISWMTSLLDLGNACSPVLACLTMNRIGRKYSLILSSVFFCAPILFLLYQDVTSLYIARFSVGFAKGMSFTIIPLYLSEIADTRIRGTLISLNTAQMYIGLTLILLVGPFITLNTLSIALCVIPFIFMVSFSFIPESPHYLASVEKYAESKKSLEWFRATEDVDEEYEALVRKAKADMQESSSFKQLFTNPMNRRALIIVLALSGLQRLGGITSLTVFGPKTFPKTNFKLFDPAQSSLILMLSLIAGAVTQIRLTDILGRRTLLIISSLTVSVLLVLMGLYFMFPSLEYSYVVYILLIAYGFAYHGVGCVPFILAGELFPMNIRCQGSTLAAVSMAVGSFFTNKFHLLLVTFTNTCAIFWIYAAFNVLIFLFAIRYVFETKCRSFAEIQILLAKSSQAKRLNVK